MRARTGAMVVAAASLVLVSTTMVGAASAESTQVLDLQLSDLVGATTAADTSGRGHDGLIGSHVVMNGEFARFDRHPPGEGVPYGYQHLITVPDAPDASLDPGSGDFTVELRYRTKEGFGNVIQKGQSHTVGGQVKFQQPKGKMTCMFKTPTGTATAGSGSTPLNDNVWHTVRCERTPTSVTMYVDGVRTGRINKPTGNLNNTKPWTIGGKSECDAVAVTCDYFAGDIDYVTMSKGAGASGGGGGGTDTTAPTLRNSSPAAGATGVKRGSNMLATFSEPVSGADQSSMVLTDASTGARYNAAVTYDASRNRAKLNPALFLPADTQFTVSLSSAIKDAAGNALAPTSFSFTTGG